MKLTKRKYRDDSDYWKIREFLRQVFLLNNRREVSWPLFRWDYWRWHINENIFRFELGAAVFLWETSSGQLAAILHPDNPGEACLQVHPALRSAALEIEMVAAAEIQYALTRPDGCQRLRIWTHAQDSLRRDLLERRGYSLQPEPEYQRWRDLSLPLPEVSLPPGYTIRPLGEEEEHPARSWLSWKVFHPSEPDDRYEGWSWYKNVQRAPLYRRDLDLVAVSPEGELAAFCTLWFDDVTRTASFEPVGVHPEHRRRGLGQAVMVEGMRRAVRLGANLASVDSYSDEAGALYASMGFTSFDLGEPWEKEW